MLTQEALYSKQQYSFAVKLGHSGEFYPAVCTPPIASHNPQQSRRAQLCEASA